MLGKVVEALKPSPFDQLEEPTLNAALAIIDSVQCRSELEVGMNAALALIEAAAPRNEIEGALAVQMACTHTAALAVPARFSGGGGSERRAG